MSKVLIDRELAERVCHVDNSTRQTARRELRTILAAPSGTPAMPVKAYYHEWTDLEGVRTRSVGLEVRKEFADAPLVLEADALARIACLEGEIAKRDEELAACRVAVENCDLFRARIAELERGYTDTEIELAGENFRLRAAIKAQEPLTVEFMQFMTAVVTGAGLLSRGKQSKGLASELSATAYKYMLGAQVSGYQQKPIGYRCWFNKEPKNIMVEWGKSLPSDMNPSATYQALYAAPVSEPKAQGVVQWPEADEIMQMAFEEGHPADDASGYYFELEEFDLFIERLMSEVARLNAATVQKASVPDDFVCDSKPLQELLNATAMLLETPCPDSATYWAAQLASVEQLLAAPSPAGLDGLDTDRNAAFKACPESGCDWGSFYLGWKARGEVEQAIIDGLRGEVGAQRVKTCAALKARNDAHEERDQQAQRIDELEGLLCTEAARVDFLDAYIVTADAPDTGKVAMLADSGTLRECIDAALSAGKERE